MTGISRNIRAAALLALSLVLSATARDVAAAQLRSLQTGTVTLSGGLLVVTLPTAVDTTKAFVVFGVSENINDPADGEVSGQLTGPTSLTFSRVAASGSITIKYYVAEFSSGVSVQRGSTDVTTGTTFDVALGAAVNTAKSFPLISYRSDGSNVNCNDFVKAKITSGTNLRLSTDSVTCGTVPTSQVEWQVVQYQDANVQTGDVTLSAGTLSQVAGLAPAVNTARSWLIYSYQGTPDATPDIGQYLARGVLTNPTTLTFDRNNAGTVAIDLTWYLVEFTDGTTVQQASEPFTAAQTQRDVTLGAAVDLGHSIAVAGGDYQRGGRSNYAADDVPGVGWFNLDLTSSTNLRITRGATGGGTATADVGWFVVSFPGCCGLATTEVAGSTIAVTAAAQFQMVFNSSAGGGIEQFYDLAESSTLDAVHDLAGGTATGKTLHGDGLGVGGNSYNTTQSAQGTKLDLLESTATRTRVRQEAFYTQEGGALVLAGAKGFGDYSIYGSGRTALRWNVRATSPVTYAYHDLDLNVHLQAAGALSSWVPYSQTDGSFPNAGTEQFFVVTNEVAGARTDFLDILYRDWTTANGYLGTADIADWFADAPNERGNPFWEDSPGTTIPAVAGPYSQPAGDTWNFLTYFKPTNFTNNADPAVTSRASDFRTPSVVTVGPGSQWQDANENTSTAGDFFNESEAAYVFDLNPATGLTFDLNGSAAAPRYSPFFKIRQWRSHVAPPTITVEGVTKIRDADYKADVKPVARAHFAQTMLWHSTLENAAALTTPDAGSAGAETGTTTNVAARYGNGLRIQGPAGSNYLGVPTAGNFNAAIGALEFWYRPDYPSNDSVDHYLAGMQQGANDFFYLLKAADNNLYFTITTAAGVSSIYTVAAANYSWRSADWVHLRIEWNDSVACVPSCVGQQRILINGVEPNHTDPSVDYVSANLSVPANFRIGSFTNGNNNGSATATGAIYDEVYLYGGSSTTPTPLAHGGLTSDASEYLANPARNFSLAFSAVDATRRGAYLYLGADSKFHGLNVLLATSGVSAMANGAIVWEYWNGTAWVDLEAVAGFGDTTSDFRKAGNVYWTADPAGWSPYSVNGGPDLYYVRAHLPTGASYTTAPVEDEITTDILLFQYCGNVTAPAQTFVFGAPAPTAVKLQSFSAIPGDRSVVLEWQTASELDNLGFYLYRGLSEDGPWTRLGSALIPGLGSSATGQAYSYHDTGLVNGTRYYYRLEDVDASSKTTSHGPVSAVPAATAAGGASGSEPDTTGANQKKAAPSSCPDWVVAAYGPTAGVPASSSTLVCTRHGDPESVSLGIASRDAGSVTLELSTGGFYALHEASGRVRVFVLGFDFPQDPLAPALPFRRALVDAVVGRSVQLGGVRGLDQVSFPGLVPSALGQVEMLVSRDGTVRAGRRGQAEASPQRSSIDLARLLPSVFQGETKSAVVVLTPLRFDVRRQQIVLSRRVLVRLLFTGRETGESGRASLGRRAPARGTPGEKPAVGEVRARVFTRSRGLHAVSFEDLFPRQTRSTPISELSLTRQGEAVAFHVEPGGVSFGPGGQLYFYADTAAASSDFSSETAYELIRTTNGTAMPLAQAPPTDRAVRSTPTREAAFEVNRFYQPGLLEAPDLWLWDAAVSGATRREPFTLTGVDASGSAMLEVYLQGASESGQAVDHHMSVSVNGVPAGEAQFAGKQAYRMSLSVPAGVLHEGANELELSNVGDTGVTSLVFLDRFTVGYAQSPSSFDHGVFEGSWTDGGTATLTGASGPVVLVDVTPTAGSSASTAVSGVWPQWLVGFEQAAGGVRFQAEPGHRYVAVTGEGLLRPRVALPAPSTLRSATNQADYLLIAPRAFLEAAGALVARREHQGLHAKAVSFEEITDEFGHGRPSAEAIGSFLAYAYQSWARPSPRYVLLLGDSTYDPRDFTGTSQPSPLPALWTKTSYLWTVSDPELAAVNGEDELPDLAIGRLPAVSVEQAQMLIAKLIAWEDSGQGLRGTAALVADNPDLAGDFEANARDIADSFLPGRSKLLLLSQLGAAMRPAITDALDSGLSYLDYVGHGGAAVWASENVWNSWDAAGLRAQSRQPLLITMNCLNGYFVAPSYDSLSESLIKADGRGAIAAFSPSGLSLDTPAHEYHRALMAELTSGRHERLGDAVLAAQQAYARTGLMPELLSVYHLLGDPGMQLR